jgi:amino acid adenylation domain-containing protein/thioester reductase-like protein
MTRHPIFQAFVRVLPESRLPSSPELSFEQVHLPRSFSRFDFLLEIVLQGSILDGWLNASADLFQAATIERLAGQFERLLEQAALAPDSPLTAFSLLSEDERRQILVEWNRTEAPFPADKLLHELFEEQVARTPDACALEFEQTTLTYAQLNQAANRLARHLQRRGAAPGSFVGVALERSIELVVALFAVLKAGCAYVAIDPEYPEERVRAMLQDASPSALLTQKKFTALFEGASAPLLVLDEMVGALQAEEGSNLPRLATPDSIAYVIFTSGSTGRPKGVMNHHRGVCNRIWWMQQEYRLDASDAVLQKTPFSFDVSVWEFFWPTMAGARLVVSKPGGHRDPYYLSQVIRARNITTLHFVPSMLQLWLEAGGVDTCTSLRRVICSGEALSNEHQRKFFECSTAELHNLYGPTEAAIDVTSWRCQRDQQGHTVPIGRPISNIQLYILDERMQPVAVGFPGELYIGGVGVAAGYVNRPELTAERFLPDPFRPGGKLYRTGDVCRWRSDGVIDYLGRADFQVKIRGFRIELGEIEHAMMQHPTVGQALVIARNQGTSRQLVAYLVPRPGQQIKRAQVREFLRGKLPDYMVPSAFVTLEQMPLSPNGKADRKALPEPEMAPETRRHESTPRTEEERKLTEIWTTLLGVPTLGVHENFFECGGHSLLVMQMLFMIRTSFGEQLSVHTIFNAPTIAQLARVLAKKTISNPPPSTRIPPPDLLVDSHLTPLVSAEAVPPFEDRPAEHILVTGASGFLGAFLLHELMQQHRKKAYCLVRAASPDEALQRLRDNLERRGLWWPGMESRIEAIPGDLGRPRFGLDEPTYQRLSSAIDAVLHNGALVDFVRPYHMLKPANVDGTVEILRFASTRKNKPVHFISTLSVFPAVKHGEDRVEREDSELDFAPTRLHGGYAQSKWVGERLCFQARERGMLINIYRPGVVLGPSGTGNAVDFFHLLVKGCLQLGLAPDLDIQFNLTPADYVAPAVIDILFAGRPGNKAYNFANPVRLRWNDLLLWLSEQGYELARCSFREWVSTLRETVENGAENALASLLYFLAEMPPEALQFPWYSTTETDAALRKTTISCTPANETLLGPWLADLQRSGFLPRPMLGLMPSP